MKAAVRAVARGVAKGVAATAVAVREAVKVEAMAVDWEAVREVDRRLLVTQPCLTASGIVTPPVSTLTLSALASKVMVGTCL